MTLTWRKNVGGEPRRALCIGKIRIGRIWHDPARVRPWGAELFLCPVSRNLKYSTTPDLARAALIEAAGKAVGEAK